MAAAAARLQWHVGNGEKMSSFSSSWEGVGWDGEGRGKETEQGRSQRGQRAGARAMGRRSCRAVPRSRAAAERWHAAAVEAEAAALLRKRLFRLGREMGVGPERRGERVPPGPGRALRCTLQLTSTRALEMENSDFREIVSIHNQSVAMTAASRKLTVASRPTPQQFLS